MNESSSQGIPFYSEQKEVIEDLMDSSKEFRQKLCLIKDLLVELWE